MDNSTKNTPKKPNIPKNNSGIKVTAGGGFESLIDDLNQSGISP